MATITPINSAAAIKRINTVIDQRNKGIETYISIDDFAVADKFFNDDISYLLRPNGATRSGRVSRKPKLFSDMKFVPGSGCCERRGFDGTDMQS